MHPHRGHDLAHGVPVERGRADLGVVADDVAAVLGDEDHALVRALEHPRQRRVLTPARRGEGDSGAAHPVQHRPQVVGHPTVPVEQRAVHVGDDESDVAALRLVGDGGSAGEWTPPQPANRDGSLDERPITPERPSSRRSHFGNVLEITHPSYGRDAHHAICSGEQQMQRRRRSVAAQIAEEAVRDEAEAQSGPRGHARDGPCH